MKFYIKRFPFLNTLGKFLGFTSLKTYKELALCNEYKMHWYKTLIANYNSNWFCLQTACDFFDFTKQGLIEFIKTDECSKIKTAIDVGAGVGLSTKFLYDNTNINMIYNNVPGKQAKVYNSLICTDTKKLLCDVYDIDEKVDAIFCFEFFEHFTHPIDVFLNLTNKTGCKYVIMQNSFGAFGYGHFPVYQLLHKKYRYNLAGPQFLKDIKKLGWKIKCVPNSRVIIAER